MTRSAHFPHGSKHFLRPGAGDAAAGTRTVFISPRSGEHDLAAEPSRRVLRAPCAKRHTTGCMVPCPGRFRGAEFGGENPAFPENFPPPQSGDGITLITVKDPLSACLIYRAARGEDWARDRLAEWIQSRRRADKGWRVAPCRCLFPCRKASPRQLRELKRRLNNDTRVTRRPPGEIDLIARQWPDVRIFGPEDVPPAPTPVASDWIDDFPIRPR